MPIPIVSGVRQGCPLSGLLFNICIDPLLRSIQGSAADHRILAYADDLLLLSPSPGELQEHLDQVCALASRIGLQFNPQKCFSLHVSGVRPIGTRPTNFSIGGAPIRTLTDGEGSEFLGKPIGFQLPVDEDAVASYLNMCNAIMTSHLAPWQRIDALKSFFYPAMAFDMRTNRLQKSAWTRIDDFARPHLKSTLYLPPEAA
ncbi:Retrovirus-related Pol polyprotein from type-2 retrotransposable element R2DM, partial [Stegodyphus mimosarum]